LRAHTGQEDEDNLSVEDDSTNTSVQAFHLKHMERKCDLVSLEFSNEEAEEFTDDSGDEDNSGESSQRLPPVDLDSIDFDVHMEEVVEVAHVHPRARFQRYIGEHLIGQDNLSSLELEDTNVLSDVIEYSGSERE